MNRFSCPNGSAGKGPAMAVGDVNGDQLDDIFLGGASGQSGEIFLQNSNRKFSRLPTAAFAADSKSEDITAVFFDADGDDDNDLFVGSGGYEFKPGDSSLQNRLYINNGKGVFSRSVNSLPKDIINDNSVAAADFNGDGMLDLFNGGFCTPGSYPLSSGSQVLINNGKGNFINATDQWLPKWDTSKLITSLAAGDIDNDGRKDLVVSGHWMGVEVWLNKGNRFEKDTRLSDTLKGLYNCVAITDLDRDGDADIVAGNQGLNNQFVSSAVEPMEMYYEDFDDNGTREPVMFYYIDHQAWPIYSRDDLMQQMPGFNKKFIYYKDYAMAGPAEIFTTEKLKNSKRYAAGQMASIVLENTGKGYALHPLPDEVQWYPLYAINFTDANGDGLTDIITGGNHSFSRIKFGAYGAGKGDVLLNKGGCKFETMAPTKTGISVRGDVRHIAALNGQLIFAINDKSPVRFEKKK